MASSNRWIQSATQKMKRRGTLGSFGRATKSKIAAAKRRGGKAAKRAQFAENMAHIAAKHRGRRRSSRS